MSVIYDDSDFTVTINGLQRSLSRREISGLLFRAASLANLGILERTARGVDSEDNFFQGYSDNYRFFRQESGRPAGVVNLFFTGQMLGAMQPRSIPSAGIALIEFVDQQQAKKAAGHHFGNRHIPKREFFRVSEDDLEKISEMARDHIEESV